MPYRNGWTPKRRQPCWWPYVNRAGCGRKSRSQGHKAAGQPGGGWSTLNYSKTPLRKLR